MKVLAKIHHHSLKVTALQNKPNNFTEAKYIIFFKLFSNFLKTIL